MEQTFPTRSQIRAQPALPTTCCLSLWLSPALQMAGWAGGPFTLSDGCSKGKPKNLKTQLTFFSTDLSPSFTGRTPAVSSARVLIGLGGYWPGPQGTPGQHSPVTVPQLLHCALGEYPCERVQVPLASFLCTLVSKTARAARCLQLTEFPSANCS